MDENTEEFLENIGLRPASGCPEKVTQSLGRNNAHLYVPFSSLLDFSLAFQPGGPRMSPTPLVRARKNENARPGRCLSRGGVRVF